MQRNTFIQGTLVFALSVSALAGSARAAEVFSQTNLISDGSVAAQTTDPNLINPWGVAFGATGPLWISDNNTGLSSVDAIVNGAVTLNAIPAVTLPVPLGQTPGTAAPTGQIFVGGSGINVSGGGKTGAAVFAFATEDGTISAWSPSVNQTNAFIEVDNSQGGTGAVYKGLATGSVNGATRVYAANFRGGQVEVYDKGFNLVGQLTDTMLPSGYAPFNVQVLGGKLYVTYALQNAAKHDDVAGAGHGFVDVFNLDGTGEQRLVSGGDLNSPWGLALAPTSFGVLAGDLLVGNFGDGTIGAYDPVTGAFLGNLLDANGNIIQIGDLWALTPGNNGNSGSSSALYFTAGVANEAHGLVGSLTPAVVAEPASMALVVTGLAALGLWRRGGRPLA